MGKLKYREYLSTPIDKIVVRELKELSKESGTPLSVLVEKALRAYYRITKTARLM